MVQVLEVLWLFCYSFWVKIWYLRVVEKHSLWNFWFWLKSSVPWSLSKIVHELRKTDTNNCSDTAPRITNALLPWGSCHCFKWHYMFYVHFFLFKWNHFWEERYYWLTCGLIANSIPPFPPGLRNNILEDCQGCSHTAMGYQPGQLRWGSSRAMITTGRMAVSALLLRSTICSRKNQDSLWIKAFGDKMRLWYGLYL